MLRLVRDVSGMKILERVKAIKIIEKKRGKAFAKYFHNRTLSIIVPKKFPGDHVHLMWNRKIYRKNAVRYLHGRLF